MELAFLGTFMIGWLAGVVTIAFTAVGSAYRNGITDGYGFSKEPNCPGYKAAGDYLKNHMAHRWHELRDEKSEDE